MAEVIHLFILLLPVLLLAVGFIVALGRCRGFRRRGADPTYSGPERRCPLRPACSREAACRLDPARCIINQSIDARRL